VCHNATIKDRYGRLAVDSNLIAFDRSKIAICVYPCLTPPSPDGGIPLTESQNQMLRSRYLKLSQENRDKRDLFEIPDIVSVIGVIYFVVYCCIKGY